MKRWLNALRECCPIIINDTNQCKESNPYEYEVYRRCGAHSILAVPFWHNPTGFMIVRNPKRFPKKSSYLQAVAYVVFSSVTEKRLLQFRGNTYTNERIKKDTDIMIKLFGEMEIHTSKGYITEEMINSPKYCCILAYFLLNDRRPRTAYSVWKEMWPRENAENAGNNLRSLFVRFKNVFSMISDYRLIVSSPRGYQLNPELNIITDLDVFDEYCTKAEMETTLQGKIEMLKKAIETYRGNVFITAGSEHWILPHEVRYKYKCLAVYNELMQAYFGSGNYVSVEYYAQQALEIEPANEDAYYWLIRSLRKRGSNIMTKGQLHMARHVLNDEEYERLMEKLDKSDI